MDITSSIGRLKKLFPEFLAASIIFYFYKTAFWPLTYLFIFSFSIVLFIYLTSFNWKFGLKGFLKIFQPPLILAGIIIIALIFNFHVNKTIIKDIVLLALLFLIFYFLYWNSEIMQREFPWRFSIYLILLITVLISLINLIFIFFVTGLPSFLIKYLHFSQGPTIANDYNFFALFLIFGLLIINIYRDETYFSFKGHLWLKILVNTFIILNILLSSSRRGIIVLFILIILYFIIYRFRGIPQKTKSELSQIFKKFSFYILGLLLIGIVIYFTIPKQKLSIVLYRYASIIGIKDYKKIENFVWQYNPKVPKDKTFLIDGESTNLDSEYWKASAEGTTLSNIETPYGDGIQMVKTGTSPGFPLLYCGPDIIYYAQHTYKISFKIKFVSGDFQSFFLGWWANDGNKGYSNSLVLDKISEPLSDGWFNCSAYYTFISNHTGLPGFFNTIGDGISFIIADFMLEDLNANPALARYVFEYEGSEDILSWINKTNAPWKTTNLINNGDFTHGLSFWKSTANETKIEVIEENNKKCAKISRGDGNGGDWSLLYSGNKVVFHKNNEYELTFLVKPLSSGEIPFNVGFWIDDGEGYKIALDQELVSIGEGWKKLTVKHLFKNNYTDPFFPINSQLNNSSFLITDIRLCNISNYQEQVAPSVATTDSVFLYRNSFDEGRISRLNLAYDIWKTKYKGASMFFGHGFKYYDWYTEKYPNDKGLSDYPHNPFISVLFYSGIIGLVLFLWFIYKTLIMYLKHLNRFFFFFVCFLITMFFSFFSGSSPFDPPIMGFFMLLPYYLNFLITNDSKIAVTSL